MSAQKMFYKKNSQGKNFSYLYNLNPSRKCEKNKLLIKNII